jgi:hypothetical protein
MITRPSDVMQTFIPSGLCFLNHLWAEFRLEKRKSEGKAAFVLYSFPDYTPVPGRSSEYRKYKKPES